MSDTETRTEKILITYIDTPLWLFVSSLATLTKRGCIITGVRYSTWRPRTWRMILQRLYDIEINVEQELENE